MEYESSVLGTLRAPAHYRDGFVSFSLCENYTTLSRRSLQNRTHCVGLRFCFLIRDHVPISVSSTISLKHKQNYLPNREFCPENLKFSGHMFWSMRIVETLSRLVEIACKVGKRLHQNLSEKQKKLFHVRKR